MLSLARRYIGVVLERPGDKDHPLIRWWLSLVGQGLEAHDEIPWCSAFVSAMAWQLELPRSTSAAARSWLSVGTMVGLEAVQPGFDVVVLKRGTGVQPGPTVLQAPGHVALYHSRDAARVMVLGGNQSNGVSLATFPIDRILGIRRLASL